MTRWHTNLLMGSVIAGMVVSGCSAASPKATSAPTTSSDVRIGVSSHASIALVRDERELVRRSTLIIRGTPIGKAQFVATSGDKSVGAFYHDVQVHEVLRGRVTSKVIRVLRAGLNPEFRAANLVSHEDLRGELASGNQILFLEPSADSGVFQIVGHWQGVLRLDPKGRVFGIEEQRLKLFDGLDVAGVRNAIEQAAAAR